MSKNNNSVRRRPRKQGRRGKSGVDRGDQNPYKAPAFDLMINRSLNYMPSRYRTRLTFMKFASVNNTTFTFANVRFEPTFCYDIDPAVGSTAMPGFTELGALYRFYRMVSCEADVGFSNIDTATVATVYICPTNIDPGANTTTAQNLLSNRRSVQRTIGPLNGNGIANHLKSVFGIEDFGGVKWTGQLDQYCGSTAGTAPSNNIFLAVGAFTTPSMTTGILADVRLTIEVEFFELATPNA